MGMATEHRGKVPFDYTMNEGDWATRTVAQGYQEEEAPFAETQINGTDVVLGGATMDDALAERIVERTKAAEVAELRERAAAAEAEAATLRAMLGISNAAAEGSMDARITSALSMLQTGNPPRVPPMPAMETARAAEVQIAREQVVAPTVVEPVGMAAAIASALAGEPAPTEERMLTAAALTTVATAAALTAAAGQTNGASVEDLRRCCEQAPRKGEQTRWSEHKAPIEVCCGAGWQTVEELQRALCEAQVHTQHKALKSYLGRNPQLRATARGAM